MPLEADSNSHQSKRKIFFLVKFFNNQRHASEFVNGRVFCNRLARFRDGESEDTTGRIDPHEGTTAWLQPGQIQLQLNGINMTDDLAGPLAMQMNWLNHLHLFCTHAVHSGDLDLQKIPNENIEELRREMMIPKACFSLGIHAVVVRDVPEFIKRLQVAARAKTCRVVQGLVRYYNPKSFHGYFRDVESVFWKQAELSYQREFRFLIDSGLPGDCPLILEVGDISDITLQLGSAELNGKKLIGGKLRLML